MSKVIVVDTRVSFLSDMTQCCKSFGGEVIQVTDPTQFNEHTLKLSDAIVVLWAEYPPVNGICVPKILMQAIAASRLHSPVVLYASRKESFANVLEPGMIYPSSIMTAHACTVAGIIKRVMLRMQTNKRMIDAFEEWAFQTKASIAGTPGKVSVFANNSNGGFDTLKGPLDPLKAVGSLCQSALCTDDREAMFY